MRLRISLSCTIAALIALSCQGWELDTEQAALEGAPPFSLAVLDSQGCTLPEGLNPKEKRIVGVKVRLTSNHPGGIPANYFYASLLTRDGSRYLAELPGCTPVLSAKPLAPGESAEGFLNFPIPVTKKPDRVSFSPELRGTSGAEALGEAERTLEVPIK